MALPAGAEGVSCMDWMNGCRTPLMDGKLKGAFTGWSLGTTPAHLYRALLEASAFGIRWIVDVLREGEIPVDSFIATGGLPHHNPDVVQIYADVLKSEIEIHPSQQGPAVGAAVLGMVAAGKAKSGFDDVAAAATAMASAKESDRRVVSPHRELSQTYDDLYTKYRELAGHIQQMTSP